MAKYDLSSLGATQVQPSYDLSSLGATQAPAAAPSSSLSDALRSHILNTLGEIGVGGARFGAGITAAPHNIAAALAQHPVLARSIPPFLPAEAYGKIAQAIPTPRPVDYEQQFGVPSPGIIGKGIEDIAQYAPAMLAAGETIPGQVAAGIGYGATQARDPITGAIMGGAVGLGAGAIPKGVEKLRPEAMAKGIMKYLSGDQGFEQSGKAVARGIKNTYGQLKTAVGNAYNKVFDATGKEEMLPSELLNLSKETTDSLGSRLGKKYSAFLENPTMRNAHNFQSDIGKEIGEINEAKFSKMGTTSDERIRRDDLRDIRSSVKNDMNSFIDTNHPELSGQNQAASQLYKDTMVPFHENKLAYRMGEGYLTNPSSAQVTRIFKNPEDDFLPLMEKFPANVKNKVIYHHIGKSPYKLTGEGLLNRTAEIDKQGLNSVLTPETANKLANLRNVVNIKKGVAPVVGATIGGVGAHLLHPGFTELGALGGAIVAPTIARTAAGVGRLAEPLTRRITEMGAGRGSLLSRGIESMLTPEMVRRFGGQ